MSTLTGSLSTNEAALAGGVIGGMIGFALVAGLIFYVLLVIAGWKMFEKAGEKGWKALIPIYDIYILYKIVKMEKWFWAMLIISFVVSLITTILGQGTQLQTVDPSTSAGVVSLILMLVMCALGLYVSILYAVRTARAFGHGVGFAIGLFFLSSIFMLILGLGKSKYDKKLVNSWK